MTPQQSQSSQRLYKLESPQLSISVSEIGGALESVINRTSAAELMGHWTSGNNLTAGFLMAPVICAISEDGKFSYQGEIYEPGKHGSARKASFTCLEQSQALLRLEQIHDPLKTPGIYPFKHKIELEYALEGNVVTTRVSIINLDERVMLFGVGLHPAFSWPFTNKADGMPYSLTLDRALPGATTIYRPYEGKVRSKSLGDNPFDLSHHWVPLAADFEKDAFFFDHSQNEGENCLTAKDASGNPKMIFELQGWDGFGVWSKPKDASNNFLCIEPFSGLGLIDKAEGTPALEEIQGLRSLKPNSTFTARMKVSFL